MQAGGRDDRWPRDAMQLVTCVKSKRRRTMATCERRRRRERESRLTSLIFDTHPHATSEKEQYTHNHHSPSSYHYTSRRSLRHTQREASSHALNLDAKDRCRRTVRRSEAGVAFTFNHSRSVQVTTNNLFLPIDCCWFIARRYSRRHVVWHLPTPHTRAHRGTHRTCAPRCIHRKAQRLAPICQARV